MTKFTNERLLSLFTSRPDAFWRHDVDVSMDAARMMARFAQLAGVSSTFYIMPRAEFYNPFSSEGAFLIEHIVKCGHRLGVHCDFRGTTDKNSPAIAASIAAYGDWRLLDNAYPDVFEEKVSFHMPPPEILWVDLPGPMENAYGVRWKDRYLSDSRGILGNEDVLALEGPVQVNLHPEHWFTKKGRIG